MKAFLTLLTGNWQSFAAIAGLVFILTAGAGYWLHNREVDRINDKHSIALTKQLNEQQEQLVDQCNRAKQIVEKANDEYRKTISDNNKRINDLKRVRGAKCIPVRKSDVPASQAGMHGIG